MNVTDFMQILGFSSPIPRFIPCSHFLAVYLHLVDLQRRSREHRNKTRCVWSLGVILPQASRSARPVLCLLLQVADLRILQRKCQKTPPSASTMADKWHRGYYSPCLWWCRSARHPCCFDGECEETNYRAEMLKSLFSLCFKWE